MLNKKLLIASGSPDHLNSNTTLRTYVGDALKKEVSEVIVSTYDLLLYNIKNVKPDIVLIFGSVMPDESFFLKLSSFKIKYNFILGFWVHDDPYEIDFKYKMELSADIIFSNDKWASEHYDHDKVYHLPLAASKEHHYREIKDSCDIELFFCGASYPNRERFMNDISSSIVKYNSLICGSEWQFPLAENKFINNYKLPDFYSNSYLTINVGRDFNLANSRYDLIPSTPGPRTFEAAMAGTAQIFLVDSLEILEYFNTDEIILVDSIAEFKEVTDTLLLDKEKLLSYRANAQKRAILEHTYEHRVLTLLEILKLNFNI